MGHIGWEKFGNCRKNTPPLQTSTYFIFFIYVFFILYFIPLPKTLTFAKFSCRISLKGENPKNKIKELLNLMLKLDFTIETSEAREKFIENYIAENNSAFTSTELETMANYILYGKDSNTGTSIVDRKEVEIDTKYSTYKKKKPESLDELIESPTFDEHIIQDPTIRNHYKVIKPKIDREKDSYIPGIKELWEQIDYWDYLIKVSEGKINDPNTKKLSPLNLYKARHFLVELRRQQFYLKDAVCPTVLMFKTNVRPSYMKADSDIPWDFEDSDFAIAPLGIISSNPKRFWYPRDIEEKDYIYNTKAHYIIDFRNSEHIYYLFEAYEDLRYECRFV